MHCEDLERFFPNRGSRLMTTRARTDRIIVFR
jgi:hypothetical protein